LRFLKKSVIITAAVYAVLFGLLVFTALYSSGNYALTSVVFIILMLIPFFVSFEKRRPQARELVPIAALSATAALGRVIFAAFPNVKPTSAIVIITGAAFGPQAGFVTGATAALASNIFFGQGPFTPWQMFAWGIMGAFAGIFKKSFKNTALICVYGFFSAFIYGWIMDLWQVLGFVNPINLKSFFLTFAASFYFDLTHAVSTVVFLFLLAKPWLKILNRVKTKYGLMKTGG
jgi:Protein of unknown function (DUF1393).